ncbi:MAG TPA: hypothetical protein VFP76_03200 [Gemmatimonadota bacterium]|nr:hypothetical protein [Gemmatimonadota bacterium]
MSGHRTPSVVVAAILAFPVLAIGQSSPAGSATDFGVSTVQVVSELRAQDRGDGSGSYALITSLKDTASKVTLRHELSSERTVEGEVISEEALLVLEDDEERYRAENDPTALGPYAMQATAWVLPFDVEFHDDPRDNYRAQQKKIAEVVHAVVPDAKVSSRGGSDGRTSATIEVPGTHPADALAQRFVGIREALYEAGLGMAKLVIKGTAVAPGETVAESP